MFDITKTQALMFGIGGLVIIALGIYIVGTARRAKNSEVAQISINGLIGIVFMAIGGGALSIAVFGKKVIDFLGIGS